MTEPVGFVRLFMGTIGAMALVSGSIRLFQMVPRLQESGASWQIFTVSVGLLGTFALSGVCWVMLATSPRLWK